MFLVRLFFLAGSLLLAAGCSGGADMAQESDGRLHVVSTTGQIHDAVVQIAGERVVATGLLGPGVDPHLYVPTEGDVSTFENADIIFYNGLFLEAQMERILEQLARSKVVVALGERQPADQLIPVGNGEYDPHIWNDPLLWSGVVALIRDTLMVEDPANAAHYEANAAAYLAAIQETHTYILGAMTTIPPEKRVLITAHDAFGYYARAYGLEVAGLQGLSTESEASTEDVQQLAELIVTRGIPAIFVETSVPPRNIEAVKAAVSAQGFAVEIGGSLFSDALGESGHPAESYLGMLRYNTDTIVAALSEYP